MTPLTDRRPAVVAFGGGHGLSASLLALRELTQRLTAVVTVADDGGSSGRLRRERGAVPPGDLRMALAALADPAAGTWPRLLQHRFTGGGALGGHAVGNLLLLGLTECLDGDLPAALAELGRLLGLPESTRVLPVCTEPLEIEAEVSGLAPQLTRVRGQLAVATTRGVVRRLRLRPAAAPVCPGVTAALADADLAVLGPGSLYTSVLPHLLVAGVARGWASTRAHRVLVQNLGPQVGETEGFSPARHLRALVEQVPTFTVDTVLADPGSVDDVAELRRAAAELGAELVLAAVGDPNRRTVHDPTRLRQALSDVMGVAQRHPERNGPAWR